MSERAESAIQGKGCPFSSFLAEGVQAAPDDLRRQEQDR